MRHELDLGHGVSARLVGVNKDAVNVAGERIYPDDVPDYVGAIVAFPDGCEGVILWWRRPGEEGPVWELHSTNPLHVEPSVRCTEPGPEHHDHHGHIRGGRWEPV